MITTDHIVTAATASEDDSRYTVEAKFYQKLPNRKIKCTLCPHECTVRDKGRGHCGVRRPGREEATLPLSAGDDYLFAGHSRLQRPLQVLPELGDLSVAPRAASRSVHPSASRC